MVATTEVKTTSIALIDDHCLFREGIKRILDLEEDFEVVAESQTGTEAESIGREHQPNIVLMDINMQDMSGIEATKRLLKASPLTKVIILSIHDEDNYVTRSLQSGASGYLLKEMSADDLVAAIRIVEDGGSYIHPKVTRSLIQEFQRISSHYNSARRVEFRKPLHLLTTRECEVLQLLADGESNRKLSESLHISEKTVKNHVSNILQKMNANDRTQAVVEAIKKGWVRV